MDEQTRAHLLVFLEFHVPLQLLKLKERGLKPHTPRFDKELRECAQTVGEKGDTILFKSSDSSQSVCQLSKGIAMLLMLCGEVEIFGQTFRI